MAPVSPKSRMRKMRAKKRLDPEKCKSAKVSEAARKRTEYNSKKRRMDNLSELDRLLHLAEIRKTKTQQKAKERANKKKVVMSSTSAFKSKASKSKALNRVRKSLPKDTCQRIELLNTISKFNLNVESNLPVSKVSTASTPIEIVKLIQGFYKSDEISRASPSSKDVRMYRNALGLKEVQPARHLLNSIRETYAIFKSENAEVCQSIGKSKFAGLRPEAVLTSNKMPHNLYVCAQYMKTGDWPSVVYVK